MTKWELMMMIKIWDILVRFIHINLILFFILAYISEDEFYNWHAIFGMLLVVLVIVRILWGFVGSKYARFINFVTKPTLAIEYIKNLFNGLILRKQQLNKKRYLGHNPAGGWMAIMLLVGILILGFSGLKIYAVQEQIHFNDAVKSIVLQIPTYTFQNENLSYSDNEEEFWEEVHETAVNLFVLLIFCHVAGVLASSLYNKENLIKAMITGYKKKQSQDKNEHKI